MAPRVRVLAFGSAAAMVVIGVLSGVLVGGVVGQAMAIGLITLGLGGALLLVFLEVGLGEDRQRAREEDGRRARAAAKASAHRSRWPGRRRPRRRG